MYKTMYVHLNIVLFVCSQRKVQKGGCHCHRPPPHPATPALAGMGKREKGDAEGEKEERELRLCVSLIHFLVHNKHALLCNKINRKAAAALT